MHWWCHIGAGLTSDALSTVRPANPRRAVCCCWLGLLLLLRGGRLVSSTSPLEGLLCWPEFSVSLLIWRLPALSHAPLAACLLCWLSTPAPMLISGASAA